MQNRKYSNKYRRKYSSWKRRIRICERNKVINEEAGGGVATGTGAEMPLQSTPGGKVGWLSADHGVHDGGADIHLQPTLELVDAQRRL